VLEQAHARASTLTIAQPAPAKRRNDMNNSGTAQVSRDGDP
jgi:hypothetical protein